MAVSDLIARRVHDCFSTSRKEVMALSSSDTAHRHVRRNMQEAEARLQ